MGNCIKTASTLAVLGDRNSWIGGTDSSHGGDGVVVQVRTVEEEVRCGC